MGKKRNRTPVVAGREEASRVPVADQLLSQGRKDFESVYGRKEAASFSVAEDMSAMHSVGMVKQQDVEAHQNNQQLMEINMEQNPTLIPVTQPQEQYTEAQMEQPEDPAAPQSEIHGLWMAETNGEVAFDEWVESKKQNDEDSLSEDPEVRAQQVVEFLAKLNPGIPVPNVNMIKSWRQMHGDIFMLNVADRQFIYRYLKRQEWIQINANPKMGELTEMQIEEDLFNRCVLWPQMDVTQKAGLPAGAVSMVVQQVRLQSLFLDPAYVSQLTIKI